MMERRHALFSGMTRMAFLTGVILLTAFCAKPRAKNAVELKFSISYPAGHPMTTDAFEVWAKRVESATSDKVKITIFPSDTLIAPITAYDAVKKGACDIAMLIQPYEPNRFPLTMIMNQPLDLPNAVVSGQIAWELYQEFPEIQDEYKDVKLLFFYSTSAYEIHSPKKAIRGREDLKGILIRVGGPVDKAIAEALGGTPEFMHMPDTYLALSKGVLDALMSSFGPMKGLRTAEVTRFHIENANLHTSIFGIIMNLDKWKKLPVETRQAIESVSGLEATELFGRVFDRTDAETIQFMKDKGDTFIRLSEEEKLEWRKSLDMIVADWVKEQEDRGLPGQQILETVLRLKEKYSRLYP
jgi:TRAP-type C4-dicarboxylate transport system substrate-binding protein